MKNLGGRKHEEGAERYDIQKQEKEMDMVVLTKGEASFIIDTMKEETDYYSHPTDDEMREAIEILEAALEKPRDISIDEVQDEEDTDNIGNR